MNNDKSRLWFLNLLFDRQLWKLSQTWLQSFDAIKLRQVFLGLMGNVKCFNFRNLFVLDFKFNICVCERSPSHNWDSFRPAPCQLLNSVVRRKALILLANPRKSADILSYTKVQRKKCKKVVVWFQLEKNVESKKKFKITLIKYVFSNVYPRPWIRDG